MAAQRYALVLLILVLVLVLDKGRHAGNVPAVAAFVRSDEKQGWVQVDGDVVNPGMFVVSANSLAIDVINLAIPACDISNHLNSIPLKTRPGSGERLTVQCGDPPLIRASIMPVSYRLALGIGLQLNGATRDDLELVPGIGRVLAGRIVEHRQKNGDFVSLDGLLNVEGIGEKKLRAISNHLKL